MIDGIKKMGLVEQRPGLNRHKPAGLVDRMLAERHSTEAQGAPKAFGIVGRMVKERQAAQGSAQAAKDAEGVQNQERGRQAAPQTPCGRGRGYRRSRKPTSCAWRSTRLKASG